MASFVAAGVGGDCKCLQTAVLTGLLPVLLLQERVKANLKQIGGGSCVTDDEVAGVISCVKGRKQKLLLQQPRRGKL